MCLSRKWSEIEAIFRYIFLPAVYLQSLLTTFPKNCFPATFGGHLEFLVERKNPLISEMEQDRVISTKFLTHRVAAESTADFPKNRFPATFGSHLEFLR